MKTENEPVLCYVEGCFAYFTTQPLSKQWGDDWNDAPYEHNAGTPYEFNAVTMKHGTQPWEIIKVAWEGPFNTPRGSQINSQWSVERINAGEIAWLRTFEWFDGDKIEIMAGTTLENFKKMVLLGGGVVYE